MFPLQRLHAALSAAAPIVGVSVGDPDDRSMWRVDFAPEATDTQKAAALQVVGAFDTEDNTEIRTRVAKDAIWRRATDDEAVQMRAALDAQPVRLREIYDGAAWIETTDELFGVLQAALVQLFGEERAAQLLEATD